MSADGEIEVKVNAEGVDEASEELAGEDGVGGGGGGGGGGGREDTGLRGSLRSGLLAGALLAALGPLVDVVGAVLEVLQVFLAPLAAVALRLLSPVLRFMLTKLLPPWLKFVNNAGDRLDTIGAGILLIISPIVLMASLLARLLDVSYNFGKWVGKVGKDTWDEFKSWANGLATGIASLPGDIWSKIKQLAGDIGQEIGKRVPGISSGPSDSPSGGGDGGLLRNNPAYDAGREAGTRVNISGGLGAFVENVEKETGVDLP